MITLLYFFIATHSTTTTTKVFLALYSSHHLIRLSSPLQWRRRGRSWSTRATLGTTTVTPRPSAFRWRARPSSASVPLATEEMGATVTVRPYMSARSVLRAVTQVFETANVNRCCLARSADASPPRTLVETQTRLKAVPGIVSVFHQHLCRV